MENVFPSFSAYTKEDRLISLISHDTILTNVKQEKRKTFDYIMINNDEYSRLTRSKAVRILFSVVALAIILDICIDLYQLIRA